MADEPFDFRKEKNKQIVEFIELHPHGYTTSQLAERFGVSYDTVSALARRAHCKNLIKKEGTAPKLPLSKKKRKEYIPPPPDTENVGIIGDTHAPFTLEGYLEFCYATFDKHNVTHVIHIGDLIDNHFASYHATDPDGLGGAKELELAISRVQEWIKKFPRVDVVIGNHDRIITRKMFDSGIPRAWFNSFQDVLNAPGWNFQEDYAYDGVQYIHGEGGHAHNRAKKDLCSTVQGHYHQLAYSQFFVGKTFRIFGMQVGCGVDKKAYNMAYAKNHPKPAIGCGLVLNHGHQPVNVMMEL